MKNFKTCTSCNEDKPFSAFSKQAAGKFGLQSRCKICYRTLYYDKDKSLAKNRLRRSDPENWKAEKKINQLRRRNYPLVRMLQEAKVRAKKKGFEFSVTIEDLCIPDFCPVLGILISMAVGHRSDSSPSIERIDNTKGYTKENTIIISWRANRLKNDASPEELVKIALFYGRKL